MAGRYWVCFFKQKTAFEVRISDWSADVCSSDLEQLQQSGLRKLRRAAADAALALVDLLQQAQRDLVERFDRDGPAGQVLRQLAEGLLERDGVLDHALPVVDRKSTRLNSSH